MKKLFIVVFLLILASPKDIFAIYDPLSVPNNKFGIHIVDENDLDNAARLVNSNGGDWGYVTLVITENDRNKDKWQKIFDKMRELHLIPLLRLAAILQDDIWLAPQENEAKNWADFLDQLKWPIKNRYVILFNEPNHAKEWGGIIDPTGYANVAASFSAELKKKSDEFFILPAGLDASAPNSADTMGEETFLKKILLANPNIFDFVDGWTSHAYPNPGFRGQTTDHGRGTLFTYRWEMELLERLGVSKSLAIFITETGWPHSDYFTPAEVAQRIVQAGETIWQAAEIVTVTPFILNYQSYPFSNFSWQKYNSDEFYPQFYAYQKIPKIAGKPIFVENPTNDESLPTLFPEPNFSNILITKSLFLLSFLFQFISRTI